MDYVLENDVKDDLEALEMMKKIIVSLLKRFPEQGIFKLVLSSTEKSIKEGG